MPPQSNPVTPPDDALVLGGGPAGCAAAILLARRGHRVGLVRPLSPPASALAESIPPSARRVLEELGALGARPICSGGCYHEAHPPERNLNGISFAVANAAGVLAALLPTRPDIVDAEAALEALGSSGRLGVD